MADSLPVVSYSSFPMVKKLLIRNASVRSTDSIFVPVEISSFLSAGSVDLLTIHVLGTSLLDWI